MFKPGDKVRCLNREWGNETVGKEYIVTKEPAKDGWFTIEADDDGRPNGYNVSNFELVERKTRRQKELYVVWQDGEDEQFYNQFSTLEDAVSQHPGEEIFKAGLELLGKFDLVTKVVKQKKRK